MNTFKKVNLICPASKATMISVAVTLTSTPIIQTALGVCVTKLNIPTKQVFPLQKNSQPIMYHEPA